MISFETLEWFQIEQRRGGSVTVDIQRRGERLVNSGEDNTTSYMISLMWISYHMYSI
jgi:hypothetical protein